MVSAYFCCCVPGVAADFLNFLTYSPMRTRIRVDADGFCKESAILYDRVNKGINPGKVAPVQRIGKSGPLFAHRLQKTGLGCLADETDISMCNAVWFSGRPGPFWLWGE
jgi:hypothetical protein